MQELEPRLSPMISIASYSFHGLVADGMMDVFHYLETCRHRYDLHTADLWNGLLGNDPEQYLRPEFLAKVRRALDEREMALVNYHVDGVHIWEDDPAVREKHYRLALRHIEAAKVLGARTLRIDSGGREHHWTDEQFDEIAKRYREYSALTADFGCRTGPETHWGAELVADNLEKLVAAVDHPAFGVLLHLGHFELGDPADGDRRIAPHAMHTHIDAKTTANRLDEALEILAAAGYEGCLGVEHHSAVNEYAEVGWQLASVRRALAKRGATPSSVAGKRNPLLRGQA